MRVSAARPIKTPAMRPNLSGVCKLVPAESDFAFLAPPQLRIDTIRHDDPLLNIRTRQKDANGDTTVDRVVEVGGRAVEIAVHGRTRMIRAFWDGSVLVMETSSEVSGNSRRIEDRWTVDQDGAWLTIERRHEQSGGPVHQRLRMRREPSPGSSV